MFIYFEREREREREGKGQRERERIPSTEPNVGFDLMRP